MAKVVSRAEVGLIGSGFKIDPKLSPIVAKKFFSRNFLGTSVSVLITRLAIIVGTNRWDAHVMRVTGL